MADEKLVAQIGAVFFIAILPSALIGLFPLWLGIHVAGVHSWASPRSSAAW